MNDVLLPVFVYLAAAVISVPVAKRLGLGSVLGYLIAGAVIGPWGLKLLGDPENVMHVAEFGVVIMLFLIGLELEPALLWRLRKAILGLGAAQVIATGALLAGAGMLAGLDWRASVVAGFTLALSSTAIVLQSLREKGIAQSDAGRGAFAVLLFQDIAVIPMLALFPLLAPPSATAALAGPLSHLPPWQSGAIVIAAIAAIVLAGRYLARPFFRIVARADVREIFTATALALVVGVALLMASVGLSPALGAFIAGVVLADSEFRHEIESDIEPFRALLLGLFFISVGAGLNIGLVAAQPLLIAGIVVGLVTLKAAVLYGLARALGGARANAAMIALALAQGGEFAFVLFTFAESARVLPSALAAPLSAAVAISMALTPLMILAGERIGGRLAASKPKEAPSRLPPVDNPDVLVAGFGRFGQIVHRLLIANGFSTSVLEHNADQVELVRTFGFRANYGDASRADMLRAAGAEHAKLLVIAVDDQDKALDIAETAKRTFPNLRVLARAYDRRHVYELMKRGVDVFERETFEGALRLGVSALRDLGFGGHRAERAGGLFRRHDHRQLLDMAKHWASGDFDAYRSAVNARQDMIEDALRRDLDQHAATTADDGWDTESLDEESQRRA